MENISFKHSFQLLATYLRPEWRRVTLLTVLLFSGIGLQLVQPQILRDFIDLATGESDGSFGGIDTLLGIAILFIVVAVTNQILRAGAGYMTQDVRWRTTNALRADLAYHCLKLDMGFHSSRPAGEMISRVDEDVNTLSNFFSQFIIQIFGNGLLILGVIVVLFREDWRIGVGFIGFVIITGSVLSWVVKLAIPYFKRFYEMGARLFAFIEERLNATEDIRANGAVAYTMLGLHKTMREQYVVEQKGFALGMLTFSTTQGFFRVGTALALALGGYLFNQDLITIGTVYLIVDYGIMLQEPLRRLTQQLQDMQRAVAGASRIQDLYFTESAIDDAGTDLLPAGALSATFDNVDFEYVPGTLVLQRVDFEVKPGRVLGLLGRTGSGKTTITRLLFRLYEASDGQVRVGDKPVATLPLGHLRQKVGMVTQEVQLFNATVRDNLTFFNDNISDVQILQALHDLELMPWYSALPDGLDTQLEAGGRGLSAGEAQLLAFTRVFLQDPGLIILDEASSRLDPATEALIERAIDKLFHNRTAIIVAHRLATIRRADEILILENGRIKEYGLRTELAEDPESHFAQLLKTGLTEVLV